MSSTQSRSVSPSWSGFRHSSQRISGPASPSDPPRPARDGFEWVWYPEGYWAERLIERRRSSNRSQASNVSGKKILPWKSRSKASSKDRARDALGRPITPGDSDHETLLSPNWFSISTLSQQTRPSHFQSCRALPQSPYLSEHDQVAALQNPGPVTARGQPDCEDTWKSSCAEEPMDGAAAQSRRGAMSVGTPKSLWRCMHHHRVKFEEPPERADEVSSRAPTPDHTPSYFTQKPIRPSPARPPMQDDKKQKEGEEEEEEEEDDDDDDDDDDERDADEYPRKPDSLPTPWPEHSSKKTSSTGPKGLRKWLTRIPRSRKNQEASKHGTRRSKNKLACDSPPSSPSGSSIMRFNREGGRERPKCVLLQIHRRARADGVTVFLPRSTQSYPAGEAQHVETPPLKHQTASGQPRSLFMEIKHPLPLDQLRDVDCSSSESMRTAPRVFSYRKDQLAAKREWWDAPKAPVRRDPVRDVSFFEFTMPEHLPNSPMCPANPSHKGKLKVCVYHGRRKQESLDEAAGIDAGAEEDEDKTDHV